MVVNRLCSSGLEACAVVAAKIKAGIIDIGIGSGVESMSVYDMNSSVNAEKLSEAIFDHPQARNCLMGMGETSENVAEKYGVSKEKQNQMAYESHQKAYKAQQAGFFKGTYILIQMK
jgi:acetyl-CoA acyltransferase 1